MNLKSRPLIIDTDIGTDIDDTFALIMALNSPEIDLRLVSTTTGDTPYRSKLTAKILEACGRTDITVATGIYQTWPDSHRTQQNWLNDHAPAALKVQTISDGINAIITTIRSSTVPVTLLCIGPLTNIYAALLAAPDIAGRCHFVGMFGSIDKGFEGKEGALPEYNVVTDIPAARAVFSAKWLSMTITPLYTCGTPLFNRERLQRLLKSPFPRAKVLSENLLAWNKNKIWSPGYSLEESLTPFDTVALYLAYSEEFLSVENMKLSIADDGMLVRYPSGNTIRVAIAWENEKAFLDHLTERLVNA